ncbi:Endonuclease/exonuclease/phosphatase [Phlyctochytrium arcticum]|nr:Endonuclease/exonuclease/phosphatase [Phlyctochytrium arcticum]
MGCLRTYRRRIPQKNRSNEGIFDCFWCLPVCGKCCRRTRKSSRIVVPEVLVEHTRETSEENLEGTEAEHEESPVSSKAKINQAGRVRIEKGPASPLLPDTWRELSSNESVETGNHRKNPDKNGPITINGAKLDHAGRVRKGKSPAQLALPSDWQELPPSSTNAEDPNHEKTASGDATVDKTGVQHESDSIRKYIASLQKTPSTTVATSSQHLAAPISSIRASRQGSDSPRMGRAQYGALKRSWSSLAQSLKLTFTRGRESSGIATEQLRVFVGTWNMNARIPVGDISAFLGDARSNKPPPFEDCHLLVLGTQECEERLETAGIWQPREKARWMELLKQVVGPKYVPVATRTLVGLHLVVFVAKRYRQAVQDISTSDVRVFLNGAKGAVAIAFRFYGRSYSFVNAHLKAHEGSADQRNADWRKINETMAFSNFTTADCTETSERGLAGKFDYIFWMGDLNYRTFLGPKKVGLAKSLLAQDPPDLNVFLANDELRHAYEAGLVFEGYSEGAITFRPTFKYDVPGIPTPPPTPAPSSLVQALSPGYDSSNKQRMPSYTDRILFRTRLPAAHATPNGHGQSNQQIPPLGQFLNSRIEIVRYTDCHSILESDHKPVYGIYRISEDLPAITHQAGLISATQSPQRPRKLWGFRRKR